MNTAVTASEVPQHIAIIMDGNGRWAQSRGLPRVVGHRAGAGAIRPVLERAEQLGVKVLTLYSFSSENWNRPTAEVDALMALCCEKLAQERAGLIESGIRLRRIGSRAGLPAEVLRELDLTEAATAGGTKITLALALNYGSRGEIVDAVRTLSARVAVGELTPSQITEELISKTLYTSDLPDPDLLIRTGGQMRLSNYLLWQLSYSEILFSNTLWPDFLPEDLCAAVDEFAHRKRTFGGIATETSAQSIPVGSHCVEQGGLS